MKRWQWFVVGLLNNGAVLALAYVLPNDWRAALVVMPLAVLNGYIIFHLFEPAEARNGR